MGYRIGVDIGGTFTDLVSLDADGNIDLFKVPSRENPAEALLEGLGMIAESHGLPLSRFIEEIDLIVHGTTVATNAVIARTGPKTGLITTKGFRDILVLRDSYKWDRWNVKMDPPKPFVPRYLTIGVEERVTSDGKIVLPLNEEDVRTGLEFFKRQNVEAIAVCLLWSITNDLHERRIAQIIAEEAPELAISISSEVQPTMREWPRACATVLDAYLKPIISRYIRELVGVLAEQGYRKDLLIVQSNGGATPATECATRPVYLILSGPSMATVSGQQYIKEQSKGNIITIDMGGTSFDVCVITNGAPTITRELRVEQMPTGITSVEVNTIGAGGGSIAWIDAGGALRVGPKSAGSFPGPACYLRGGTEPTVTDANVVLGYLNPKGLLGRKMKIDPAASYAVIEQCIAKPLGISVERAADGILQVVNQNMVAGIEEVSLRRGLDPRDYTLVVAGGAGPLHGVRLAKELGMKHCIAPKAAGQFCALGLAMADIKHEFMESYGCRSTDLNLDRINEIYQRMENQARQQLMDEGIPEERIRLERYVDVRYPRQIRELTVCVPEGTIGKAAIQKILDRFHDTHEQIYTYAVRDSVCEFLTWRLTAIGLVDKPNLPDFMGSIIDPSPALSGTREAYFEELGGFSPTPVYDGNKVLGGMVINGPAIIEEIGTTLLIIPGSVATVTRTGDYEIDINSQTQFEKEGAGCFEGK